MKNILQKLSIGVSLIVGLSSTEALAHPHEFITMQIRAAFDEKGMVAGMRYNWTFDEFFSAYALEGQDKNGNGTVEQDEMDAVLVEILGNIEGIKYFTVFDKKGVVPALEKAAPIGTEMKGRQLSITFDIPFKASIDVKEKAFKYAVYDPQFYIAMEHDPDKDGVILANAPKGCSSDIGAPAPSEDIQDFASSLGKDESGGDDLGASFAEWVTISCK